MKYINAFAITRHIYVI